LKLGHPYLDAKQPAQGTIYRQALKENDANS